MSKIYSVYTYKIVLFLQCYYFAYMCIIMHVLSFFKDNFNGNCGQDIFRSLLTFFFFVLLWDYKTKSKLAFCLSKQLVGRQYRKEKSLTSYSNIYTVSSYMWTNTCILQQCSDNDIKMVVFNFSTAGHFPIWVVSEWGQWHGGEVLSCLSCKESIP